MDVRDVAVIVHDQDVFTGVLPGRPTPPTLPCCGREGSRAPAPPLCRSGEGGWGPGASTIRRLGRAAIRARSARRAAAPRPGAAASARTVPPCSSTSDLHDRKAPRPPPASPRRGRIPPTIEPIEDQPALRFWDAGAAVGNDNRNLLTVCVRRYLNLAAFGAGTWRRSRAGSSGSGPFGGGRPGSAARHRAPVRARSGRAARTGAKVPRRSR